MAEKHPPSPKRGDDTLSLGRLQVKPAMRDMVRFMVVLCEKWYKKGRQHLRAGDLPL